MLRLTFFLVPLFLFTTPSYSLDLKILHTRPECNHGGHTSAWCTLEDTKEAEERAGMVKEINKMIDLANNSDSKIYIGYFSFSNKKVFNKLCEKGKEGISIEGFFDYDYSGNDQLPSRLSNECQGEGGKNIKIRFLGNKKITQDPETGENEVEEWRLHHNKFLIVEPGQKRDVSLSFSSGNLSTFGTSLHFDHWVTTVAPFESGLVKTHRCVLEGLHAAVDDSELEKDDPGLYIETYNACYETLNLSPDTALKEDGIYLLNSPNYSGHTDKALIKEIKALGQKALENKNEKYEIYGAIQHFTHSGIARELNRLCNRKDGEGRVAVNLIMDDDIVRGDSEVPKVDDFFNRFLKNKTNGGTSCINITFMETNASIKQMMHNKFIIFTGPNYARSFSGAGHFTYAAMRNNYENFYVSNNKSLVTQYKSLYDYMNKNSLCYDDIAD